MNKITFSFIPSLCCAFLLWGCETSQHTPEPLESGYNLSPLSFLHLSGWQDQPSDKDLEGFVLAFEKSCNRIQKKNPKALLGQEPEWGTIGQWQSICQTLPKQDIAPWIENNFQPYKVTNKANDPEGLFTGYYEASLNGSTMQTERYHVPLREKPQDLISVDLGLFRDALKGQRIAGRIVEDKLRPYEDRSEIIAQKMPLKYDQTLMWVDSPIDAFFLEIQGSGIVQMPDGSAQRVGYAGQNGHEYTAIGRTLIDMGELTKDTVSMSSIRTWLESHPDKAQDLMNKNRSYVFFRKLNTTGPLGAEGVPLTPEFSLAIDRGLYPYGMPIWIDVESPLENQPNIQRLMVAQDTGGAIKGAVRGDVFWGYGAHAASMAGNMKSKGQMVVFVPK